MHHYAPVYTRAGSVILVQCFGALCRLYFMKIVFCMQSNLVLVLGKNFFFEAVGWQHSPLQVSNVLSSIKSNNSMLLHHRKLRIQKCEVEMTKCTKLTQPLKQTIIHQHTTVYQNMFTYSSIHQCSGTIHSY